MRVDRRKIDLAEPIKHVGRYAVAVAIFEDVRVEVRDARRPRRRRAAAGEEPGRSRRPRPPKRRERGGRRRGRARRGTRPDRAGASSRKTEDVQPIRGRVACRGNRRGRAAPEDASPPKATGEAASRPKSSRRAGRISTSPVRGLWKIRDELPRRAAFSSVRPSGDAVDRWRRIGRTCSVHPASSRLLAVGTERRGFAAFHPLKSARPGG